MAIGHPTTPESFWAQCRRGEEECWPFPGTVAATGHVFVSVKHKTFYAHRLAFELAFRPLAPREPVVQTCDNRACCNPGHLRSSSYAEMHAGRPDRTIPTDERFDAKVERTAGGCWQWTGALTAGGYGHFVLVTTKGHEMHVQAHRYAYERTRGAIPDGLQLDHLCRNRWCVNPDHLEPVTARENILRGESPAARVVRAGVCQKGHPMTEDNTYVHVGKRGTSRSCRMCMRERERRRPKRPNWYTLHPRAS